MKIVTQNSAFSFILFTGGLTVNHYLVNSSPNSIILVFRDMLMLFSRFRISFKQNFSKRVKTF